jgi:pectin methylesterase-like acyl-CoA thioesterase
MRIIWIVAVAVAGIDCVAQANDYFVDPNGTNGAFTSIQSAINAVPAGTATNRTNIFIAPGEYTETSGSNGNLNIGKPYVSLIGQGASPNVVVIQNSVGGLTGSTRVHSSASDFMAKNLTFKSTVGDNNGVGVAMRNSADRSAFQNVHFVGFQDTLLAENGARQYYRDCYITGDTDFIFGSATAVFESSVINSTSGGYVTAANTSPQQAVGFVFLNSTLTAVGSPGAGPRSVALGRPWQWPNGTSASVAFINTKMGSHISTTGWDPWSSSGGDNGNPNPDGASRYSEFNSMDLSGNPLPVGPNGVPTGRAGWADPMTAAQAAAYTIENIFSGPAFWNSHPELQPEFIGPYNQQSGVRPWDPIASLAALPPIPEPASLLLLAFASALLGGFRLRK